MSKKIKVYLQYPWGSSDSQYYKSMIDNPPRGVEYIETKEKVGMIGSNNKFFISNFLKYQIRKWTNKAGLIIPNAHFTKNSEEYDLIHCAHCLSKNNNKPWVADAESLWQMWISGMNKRGAKEKVLKYLMKDNCKKIMAWSEAAKRDIVNKFPEIRDKVEVVYYGMREQEQKAKKSEEIILFFSGRHFLPKGGLHATEVIDRLTKKYENVRGIINGVIPKDIIKKYSHNKKLEFYQLMPYKDILKIYQKSDIFVYPGYSDSFGFVFMDAMAFGLPIVTVDNGGCRREIVKNEFIVNIDQLDKLDIFNLDEKIISKLCGKVSLLIENRRLRDKISGEGLKNIANGKFSIKKRNEKLEKIYTEAMK